MSSESPTVLQRLAGRRVGVVLSAGYFGFYGHAGFVEGLLEQGLAPSAWAGTSAGGMVSAFAAAGVPPARIAELVLKQRKKHFWDPDYLGLAAATLRPGHRASGLLKGDAFRKLLAEFLPVQRFEELSTPLLLVATCLTTQTPRALTTGDLASAVHATCAYPGLFQAVRRDDVLLWDGGIVDKAPALALMDSPLGAKLDALIVHYLPSRDVAQEPAGLLAWPRGLASGFAAVRKDHFRLQLEVLKARGVEVHLVTSDLPPVTPDTMDQGPVAMAAGKQAALDALAARSPAA